MPVFDANPHPDERIEWLRAQVEEYVKAAKKNVHADELPRIEVPLIIFVQWMEDRFQPRDFLSR